MARTTITLAPDDSLAQPSARAAALLGWLVLSLACSSEGSPASGSAAPDVDPMGTNTTPPAGTSPDPSLPGQASAGGSEANPAAQAPLDPGTSAGAVDSDWCRALGVFRENCQSCHGSELRFGAPMPLTSFDELQATSVSDTEQSVAQRVQARIHDAARPMPPGGMPAEDLALLDAWFATGSTPGADVTCAGLAPASAPTETPEFAWPSDCEEFYTLTTSSRSDSAAKYVVAPGTEEHPQFIFDAPWGDDEVQVLAYRPVTDNARVLHHWILYENDTSLFGGGLGGKFLVGWAPGSPGGTGFPDDVGLYMPNGAGSLRLDVHYYNLGNAEPASDQSGVELCITRTPRPQTATVVGLTGDATARVGRSDNATPCTVNLTGTDAVTFLSVSPHMHKLGVHAKLDLTRSGQTSSLHDAPFDFEDQQIYTLDDVAIRDGDVLTTTCSFENDTGRTVRFGQNSDDEMCFNFVTYYPMGAFQCGFSL